MRTARTLLAWMFAPLLAGAAPALAATIHLRASLDGAQVPLAVGGKGTGVVTFDTVSKVLSWSVTYSGLSGACTDAHFHGPASAGVNNIPTVGMTCSASPLTGNSAPLNATQEAQLLSGQWYINIHTALNPGGEIRGQVIRVHGDMSGDGRSDVLWRNASTGENYLYPMNGTAILASEGYLRTVADLNWRVVGIGDFDGDGKADILWRNSFTGENYVYLMNGTTVAGEGYLRTVASQNWQVAGVGDFNGDGRADILWRNASTGENYLYPMSGTTILGTEGYLRMVADQDWQVAGVGDFNGDGKADILWRNGSTGENYLYPMDGTTILGSEGYLRTVADLAWKIAGTGDFNGDGRADILWRNTSTGENYLYPMNGTTILGTEGYLRTVADQAWQVAALGDYDGDGRADILWRNATSGENYLYFMDGTAIKPTEGYIRTVADQSWRVASVANAGSAPVANAGAPATYNGGETAALDGTASTDPDGDPIAGYFWTQVSGTPVSLSNPRAAKPLFAVPNVNDTLTFRLIVSDGKAQSAASTVAITCLPYSGSAVVLQGNPFGESLDLPASAMDVAVAGNYAYVADSTAGLKIIDISNPVGPVLVGTYDTPGNAQRVTLSGSYAYIADHSGGVQIIDVSNPAVPVFVGSYATPEFVFDVAVTGSLAFVAGDAYPTLNGFLDIVDVSNPASPVRVGRYQTYGTKWAVAVSGNFAYLASGGVAGMYVIDISNPAAPTEVGSFASLTPTDLVVVGNQVFLADFDWGLRIIDVSNPAAPSLIGSFNPAGTPGMQAVGISVAGSYAYLAGLNGMHAINVSNAAAPQLEGSYRVAHLSLYRGVAVAGQYAYLADQNHRFQIIDVSNPAFSSVLNSVATPGLAVDAAMSGQHVIVEESASGLQDFSGIEIFDISAPHAPSLLAHFAMPYGAPQLVLAGNYLYLPLYFDGIYVVDISNVASPTPRSVIVYHPIFNPVPNDIEVVGNLLYTIGSAGLRIIDVSDVTNPILVGSSDKTGNKIKVVGALAFIDGLEILDVSTLPNPIPVGSLNTFGGVTQIAVAGNYAYVSGSSGIRIFNVSSPSSPTAIGDFSTLDIAEGIAVAGNYAYVPNRFYGTKILDISDPSAPFLAGKYDLPITANAVAVDADNIYITAGENGFAVAERAPRLNARYVEGPASGALNYSVGWTDTQIPANVQVRCQVTGGTCAVTGIDQAGNTASVQWSLPGAPGHHEILFTVGNWQHFVTTKDRVIAH